MVGQRKEEMTEKALDIAYKIPDDYYISKALSFIVPKLDGERKEELMERVLDIASKIESDYARVQALSFIVPKLDGQRIEELMGKALDAVYKIKDARDRAKVLHIVSQYGRNLPIDSLYYLWGRKAQTSSESTRASLLSDIIELVPLISVLSERETFSEISQAIIDVSRWWP